MLSNHCHHFCHHYPRFSQSVDAQGFTSVFVSYRGLEVLILSSVLKEIQKRCNSTNNIKVLQRLSLVVTLVVTKKWPASYFSLSEITAILSVNCTKGNINGKIYEGLQS